MSTISIHNNTRERSDARAEAGTVLWGTPTPGLWVLNRAQTFGGTIDRRGPHFAVTDGRGESLGQFDTLTAAQHFLLAHNNRTTTKIGYAA